MLQSMDNGQAMRSDLSPREIVRRSIHFEGTPRIGFKLPTPWPCDIFKVGRARAPNRLTTGWTPNGPFMEHTDEWGNTWRRIGEITKGEVSHGVIEEDWRLLDTYEWPDVSSPEIWRDAARRCGELHAQGYYVLGSANWPFNVARYMRRFENFLYDIAADRDQVVRLLDGVTRVIEKEIEGCAAAGVDGISTGEDWGTQDRLLVSPAMWREVFKPLYRRLCNAAHAKGLDVWLHSCGRVTEIIEDWIEVGVNVCLFDQPELHGIDLLAKRFGGRMAFCTPVDIQRTLQTRDSERVDAAAREYVTKLGAFDGGFIADWYSDNDGIGLTPDVQEVACRSFVRHGDPQNLLGLPEGLR
jgi:uroporphyrinogen decarboxylase